MPQRVLLIGPDDESRRALHVLLDRRGLTVLAADGIDGADGTRPDLVFAVAELAGAACRLAPVIAVARTRDLAQATALLEAGVADILSDPIDDLAITLALRHAAAMPRRSPVIATSLVGDGAAMDQLKTMIRMVAPTRTTVLVTGESGTGKELVARAIHDASPRRDRRFVAFNCAAIPAALMESELFGHVRGAFTDAVRDKLGLFEEADGGTIFLDEVGELPVALQAKLLRALQESEIRRVGDTAPIKIDIRLIAATLRDLATEVAEGRFREDLYYRLNVVPVHVPALRDRSEDIPQLARFFVARHATRHGRAVSIDDAAVDALARQPWPGNVRELENVIERALVLSESPCIDLEFLKSVMTMKDGAREPDDSELSIKKATRSLEQELIRRALGVTQGNRTNAAKLLEISHRALLYKMKEYGIS